MHVSRAPRLQGSLTRLGRAKSKSPSWDEKIQACSSLEPREPAVNPDVRTPHAQLNGWMRFDSCQCSFIHLCLKSAGGVLHRGSTIDYPDGKVARRLPELNTNKKSVDRWYLFLDLDLNLNLTLTLILTLTPTPTPTLNLKTITLPTPLDPRRDLVTPWRSLENSERQRETGVVRKASSREEWDWWKP